MSLLLLNGDSRKIPLADESVHCIVTSPPYWGLRNYAENAQIGLEQTPDDYIHEIVMVFRELRRVLHPTGTVWLNLGDSYNSSPPGNKNAPMSKSNLNGIHTSLRYRARLEETQQRQQERRRLSPGLKPKDMVGIPWRVALALQADGWWLRSDIIWHKPSTMPESVNGWRWEQHKVKMSTSRRAKEDSYHTVAQPNKKAHSARNGRDFEDQSDRYVDCPGCEKCEANDGLVLRRGSWRPTSSYEHIFLLTKSSDYFCDKDAVAEPLTMAAIKRNQSGWNGDEDRTYVNGKQNNMSKYFATEETKEQATKNQRDIWTIPPAGWAGSHFAVFPPEVPRRCIKAGTSEKGVCPDCGYPWARVVTKTTAVSRPDNPNDVLPYGAESGLTQGTGATTLHKYRGTIANGWKATCTCGKEPVPAVVFDPFVGSGTTLQAARELGRNGIGLDLSFTYLQEEAKKRLSLDLLDAFQRGTGITVSQETRRKRQVNENQMTLL